MIDLFVNNKTDKKFIYLDTFGGKIMENEVKSPIILPKKKILESSINVSSIHSIYSHTHEKGFIFSGESHPYYEINIITEGTLGLTIDDKLYELNEGCGVIIPAGAFHKNWTIGQSDVKFFVVSFEAVTNGISLSDNIVYTISENDFFYINKIISEGLDLTHEKSTPAPYAQQMIKNCIECLVLSMLRQCVETTAYTSVSSDIFYKAIHYMNKNIHKNITMDEIAEVANTSIANLKKVFKKYTGNGTIHHFNMLKLEYAKELLKMETPVGEIAFMLSFSSQNHFAQSFKKAFGVTPTEYKKKWRELP